MIADLASLTLVAHGNGVAAADGGNFGPSTSEETGRTTHANSAGGGLDRQERQEIREIREEGGLGRGKLQQAEFPKFSGEDSDGWLFRIERFFNINGSNKEEKLGLAGIALEGDALAWYQWEEGRRPFSGWDDFKRSILECFRSSPEGNLYERLLSIKQEGSVRDYRR